MAAKSSKGGRPTYKVNKRDSETVLRLGKLGVPHDDIAKVIGFAKNTLYKYYRPELEQADNEVLGKCYAALLRLVEKDDFQAVKFVIDRRYGGYVKVQKEIAEHKHKLDMERQAKENEGRVTANKVLAPVVVESLPDGSLINQIRNAEHAEH